MIQESERKTGGGEEVFRWLRFSPSFFFSTKNEKKRLSPLPRRRAFFFFFRFSRSERRSLRFVRDGVPHTSTVAFENRHIPRYAPSRDARGPSGDRRGASR